MPSLAAQSIFFARACFMALAFVSFALISSPAQSAVTPQELSVSFRAAIEQVKPAVVSIRAERRPNAANQEGRIQNWLEQFFPQGEDNGPSIEPPMQNWQGSGVIVSPDGEILTNNHVIEYESQPATHIRVKLDDETELDATVMHTDPETDIALLQIEGEGPFPYADLGDSDALQVGEWVLAIGNPFGLHQSVSQGIVSATGRTNTDVAVPIKNYIQTTAAINLGNSGGPLINLDGEVIGLNNAIHTAFGVPANIGIGFAIPINLVKRVANDLKQFGMVKRGYLGVVMPRTEDYRSQFEEQYQINYGVLIEQVHPEMPAQKAGLRSGDLILNIDGEKVRNQGDLIKMISDKLAGDTVTITYFRGGETREVQVNLVQRPSMDQLTQIEQPKTLIENHLGLSVQTLTPERAEMLGFADPIEGVVVNRVYANSPAAEVDIQAGDVITEADSKDITSVQDLRNLVQDAVDNMDANEQRPLLIEVDRADSRFFPTYYALKIRP